MDNKDKAKEQEDEDLDVDFSRVKKIFKWKGKSAKDLPKQNSESKKEAEAAEKQEEKFEEKASEQFENDKGKLDGTTMRRARHVVTENARVLDAVRALRAEDARSCNYQWQR